MYLNITVIIIFCKFYRKIFKQPKNSALYVTDYVSELDTSRCEIRNYWCNYDLLEEVTILDDQLID